VANSVWIFAWHFSFFVPSIFIMLNILLTLIAIYARLKIGLPGQTVPTAERWYNQTKLEVKHESASNR
jgi:hypothetical protein